MEGTNKQTLNTDCLCFMLLTDSMQVIVAGTVVFDVPVKSWKSWWHLITVPHLQQDNLKYQFYSNTCLNFVSVGTRKKKKSELNPCPKTTDYYKVTFYVVNFRKNRKIKSK